MLFDRPLTSFTNNIIYINCPNNYKTRLKVVCTIFRFLKITSFHTPHNNFKTLLHPSKLQREKWQEKLSQILDPLLFSDTFPCFFFFQVRVDQEVFDEGFVLAGKSKKEREKTVYRNSFNQTIFNENGDYAFVTEGNYAFLVVLEDTNPIN